MRIVQLAAERCARLWHREVFQWIIIKKQTYAAQVRAQMTAEEQQRQQQQAAYQQHVKNLNDVVAIAKPTTAASKTRCRLLPTLSVLNRQRS